MNKFGLPERTIKELLEYFKSKPEVKKVMIMVHVLKEILKTVQILILLYGQMAKALMN